MKKTIRLTEKDVENLVKKIIKEEKEGDLKKTCWKGYEAIGMKTKNGKKVPNCVPIKENWRKGGWQDGQGKPGWLEDPNYSDREFERRKMNDEDLNQPYPTPEDQRGWQDGDGEPPSQNEDYMGDNNSNNYMFWQNLETIQQAVQEMMEMDRDEVDELLSDGHGWALDHIATSTDDIEEVYHFLSGNGEEEEEEYDYEGDINESNGKGSCANRKLNTPWLTPDGPKKRSVCVKNGEGNVVKVNFGDPNMTIKKSNPERRKSFRARHRCENPGPKWRARYWSCKFW